MPVDTVGPDHMPALCHWAGAVRPDSDLSGAANGGIEEAVMVEGIKQRLSPTSDFVVAPALKISAPDGSPEAEFHYASWPYCRPKAPKTPEKYRFAPAVA